MVTRSQRARERRDRVRRGLTLQRHIPGCEPHSPVRALILERLLGGTLMVVSHRNQLDTPFPAALSSTA